MKRTKLKFISASNESDYERKLSKFEGSHDIISVSHSGSIAVTSDGDYNEYSCIIVYTEREDHEQK
jgi:hypothetical protein